MEKAIFRHMRSQKCLLFVHFLSGMYLKMHLLKVGKKIKREEDTGSVGITGWW